MLDLLAKISMEPWALYPPYLQTVIRVASREGQVEWEKIKEAKALVGEERRLKREDGTRTYKTMKGNVAVIGVEGAIFPKANLIVDFSGGTSLETLMRDYREALEDKKVAGILFHHNSPGGSAAGICEFARTIRNNLGKKPHASYCIGMTASASYLLSVATGRVVVDAMTLVGSVGVYFGFQDDSAYLEALGIKEKAITSKQSPKKNIDPFSEEGEKEYQMLANDMCDEFLGMIAEFRGVSKESVIKNYANGFVKSGRQAVMAGMADEISTFEELLAQMQREKIETSSTITAESKSGKPNMEEKEMEPEKLGQQIAELAEKNGALQAENSGFQAKITTLEQETGELKSKVETFENEKGELAQEKIGLESKVTELEAENAELTRQVADLENEEKTDLPPKSNGTGGEGEDDLQDLV